MKNRLTIKRATKSLLATISTFTILLGGFSTPVRAEVSFAPTVGDIIADVTGGTLSTGNFGREYPNDAGGMAIRYVAPNTHYYWSVTASFCRQGSPVDAIRMKVYRGGTFTSGTLMATTGGYLGSALSNNCATPTTLNYQLATPLEFVGGEVYWLVFERTGIPHNSQYYHFVIYTTATTPTRNPSDAIDFRRYGSDNGFGTTAYWVAKVYGNEFLGDPALFSPTASDSSFSLSGASTFCGTIADPETVFGIPYGLCYILGFLFVPSQSSLNGFLNNATLVKTKIPYSYIEEVQDLFVGISSSSGEFPSMEVPFTINASTSHFTLFSLDSVKEYLPDATLAIFRNLMIAILWFGFAFWVWNQGKALFKG